MLHLDGDMHRALLVPGGGELQVVEAHVGQVLPRFPVGREVRLISRWKVTKGNHLSVGVFPEVMDGHSGHGTRTMSTMTIWS